MLGHVTISYEPLKGGMLWCCVGSVFALQSSCVPISRYLKEVVSSVYDKNVFLIPCFCHCVLFMQSEERLH